MALYPHFCERTDCESNTNGHCTFYTGDMYFEICLGTGNNYRPRKKEAVPETTETENTD